MAWPSRRTTPPPDRQPARRHPEQSFHRQVCEFLAVALRPPTWFTTFPAGGGGRLRGAFLKASGLRPGVPDLLVLDAGHLLGLELKAGKGRLSPAQSSCHAALKAAGAEIAVCRSLDEVVAALDRCGVTLHARPLGLAVGHSESSDSDMRHRRVPRHHAG